MRLLLVFFHIVLVGTQIWVSAHYKNDLEDNEFAEFEDFEEDEEPLLVRDEEGSDQEGNSAGRKPVDSEDLDDDEEEEDDGIVEEDESEFDHFQDEEEFEGFDSEHRVNGKEGGDEAPKITITKVPLHFRANWDSYYLEMLMATGLIVYAINFFTGKAKNHKLANAWFFAHRGLLEENFSLVGDDGKMENEMPGLMKESESSYQLWCSGRTCCEGMLVELKFLKRQDLVAVIAQMIRPACDQVHLRVDVNKEDMDSFVVCLATKKTGTRLAKDMADLSTYCPERRAVDKYGIPSQFTLLCEIAEVASTLFDARIVAAINKYAELIDYIHLSDQYSGHKQPEDANVTKLPDVKRVMMFGLNVPSTKGRSVTEAMEEMRPLLQLVFYCMEKLRRFRLSKEAKNKADKNRLRVEEVFLKTTHAARAEAAAARREEKKRQEKERILLEDDPDKQRKWEDREMKRQMKKKAPKMKQLKVKAL